MKEEKEKSQWEKELQEKIDAECKQKSYCTTVKPRFNRSPLDKPIEYKPSFVEQDC